MIIKMVAVKTESETRPVISAKRTGAKIGALKNAATPASLIGSDKRVAVVLVRSWCGANPDTVKTLDLLRLRRKNFCVVVRGTPANMGMVWKVKDYVTFGEISSETFDLLVSKRGEDYNAPLQDAKGKVKSVTIDYKGRKLKPYFRMNPPRKGFGRKGIKVPFGVGGALGYRGEKMNDIVLRML